MDETLIRDSPDDGPEREFDPREACEDSDFALWVESQYSRLTEVPTREAAA